MQLWRGEQLGAQRALSQLESRWVVGGAQESEEAPWAGEWVRRSCWDPPYCPCLLYTSDAADDYLEV